jgi:hypothetical protein
VPVKTFDAGTAPFDTATPPNPSPEIVPLPAVSVTFSTAPPEPKAFVPNTIRLVVLTTIGTVAGNVSGSEVADAAACSVTVPSTDRAADASLTVRASPEPVYFR